MRQQEANEPTLTAAISTAQQAASTQFNNAAKALNDLLAQWPPSDPRKYAADVAAAQNQMFGALQQLVQLQAMISDQRGRDGYDAAVTLMENARDTAATAFDCVTKLVTDMKDNPGTQADQQSRNQALTTLAGVLQALARLAPIALWQKAAPASGP